jgi:hypothetical protein
MEECRKSEPCSEVSSLNSKHTFDRPAQAEWTAFFAVKIEDFCDRPRTRSGSPLAPLALAAAARSSVEASFLKSHLMATVSVVVDLLDLIVKYRNIATGVVVTLVVPSTEIGGSL